MDQEGPQHKAVVRNGAFCSWAPMFGETHGCPHPDSDRTSDHVLLVRVCRGKPKKGQRAVSSSPTPDPPCALPGAYQGCRIRDVPLRHRDVGTFASRLPSPGVRTWLTLSGWISTSLNHSKQTCKMLSNNNHENAPHPALVRLGRARGAVQGTYPGIILI